MAASTGHRSPAQGDSVISKLTAGGTLAGALEGLLLSLLQAHEDARRSISDQRSALRAGDVVALSRAIAQADSAAAELSKLDRIRREVTVRACAAFPSLSAAAKNHSVTLGMIAAHMPLAAQRALAALCQQVRDVATTLRVEAASAHLAAASLAGHIEAVVRQVGRKLSHSGTYGRRGVVEHREAVVSSLDMRS